MLVPHSTHRGAPHGVAHHPATLRRRRPRKRRRSVKSFHYGLDSITASVRHIAPRVMVGHPASEVALRAGPAARVERLV